MSAITDTRDILRGAAALLFGFGGRLIARILVVLVAGRLFGATEFGILGLTAAIAEITAAIGVLGLKRSLLDMLSYNVEQGLSEAQRVVEAIIVVLVVSFGLSIILIFLWPILVPGHEKLLPFLFIAVPAIAFTEVALTAIKHKRIIKWDVWARGFNEPWGFLTITLLLFWADIIKGGLVLAYVGSVSILATTVGYGLLKTYGLANLLQATPQLKNCLAIPKKSIPVGITDLGVMMLRRIDILILALFVPSSGVGIYYMVQQLATVPQRVNTLFEPMISPVIARLHNRFDASSIKANLIGICRWIFVIQVAITIPIVIFGDFVLSWFNPVFASGGLVLGIILFAELIDGTFITTETPLVFANPKIPPTLIVITLVIELVLIAVLSKLWGIEGAAFGFLIAILCLSIGRLVMLKSRLQINVINTSYILPLVLSIIMALVLIAAKFLIAPEQWWITTLIVILTIICYVLLIRKFGLSKSDRILLRAIKQKRRREKRTRRANK
ncbi:MAG: oligosaccharide flippase family protein [Robiginitomaculum sp.]|nr:oligosaccharide flippase family protein [Robiginitomaculum sp.]